MGFFKKKKHLTGNVTERRKNGNVITEMRRKHDRSFSTRKHNGYARPVHGKPDHHVSAGRRRDGLKQLHVSVEFIKYGNTLFRPVCSFMEKNIFSESPNKC